MVSEWPKYDEALCFGEASANFEKIIAAIRAIRNVRAEMNVPPSKKASVYIETDFEPVFEAGAVFFERLASADHVAVGGPFQMEGAVQVVTDSARIFLPMEQLIDKSKELDRLNREKTTCEKDIAVISAKLSNENFVQRAPEQVVNQEREKLSKAQERLEKILQSITALQ